jgi:hypothetical protein
MGCQAKLTDEELGAKLEAMKLKNAALTAAHERSQADEELFNAREALAAQRRKEDRVNRQQMMGERERNRQRKLQAVGGREWDAEKKEDDFREDRRKARRGAFGGVVGERPVADSTEDEQRSGGDRSRGDRGQRSRGPGGRASDRRGRGRGGGASRGSEKTQSGGGSGPSVPAPAAIPPTVADFPELPASTAQTGEEKPPQKLEFPIKPKDPVFTLDPLTSPSGEKKSWADQVENATGG